VRLTDVGCFPGGNVNRGKRRRSRSRRRSGSMRGRSMGGMMRPGVNGRRVAWGCRIVRRSTGGNGRKMVGGSAAAESRGSKRPPLVRKLLRTGARVSAFKETALVAKLDECG